MWQSLRCSLTLSHAKAASLALLLFVYPILVLSALSVHYTETMHRITMERIFNQSIFGSVLADSLASIGFLVLFLTLKSAMWPRILGISVFGLATAALIADVQQLVFFGIATLPVLMGLIALSLIWNRRTASPNITQSVSNFPRKTVAMVYLGIVIAVEVGALGRWLSYPAIPTEIYGDPSWALALLESSLFQVFDLLSPVLFIVAALSFVYRWYVPALVNRIFRRNDKGSTSPSFGVNHSSSVSPKTEYH
ncbi:MAG TPA: hypothetical protein VJ742_04260, partial [Nitrososphaera sp.]|nr:hypothetical protein [Nitrososphaera sp.]